MISGGYRDRVAFFSSALRPISLTSAPRSLKEPVRCSVSSFRYTVAPSASESGPDRIVGVRTTLPTMRSAARRISVIVTPMIFLASAPAEAKIACNR
jgi:hypothetical protein